MPVHGRIAKVLANGYDLSAYLRKVNISGEADTAETSTFGKLSKTFIAGLTDAKLSAEGLFDMAPTAVDPVLAAALGIDDVVWLYLPEGDAVGKRAIGMLGVETSYEVSSEVSDVTQVTADAQGSTSGAEAGAVLHGVVAETASGQAASVDNAAATTKGGSAYVEQTALTGAGATLTAKVQHSTDNAVWVDLVTFTVQTAANKAERIPVSGTINRYARASWVIAGTAPSIAFAVALTRK